MSCWKDLTKLDKVTSNEHRKNWTPRASKRTKKKEEKKSKEAKNLLSIWTLQTKRKPAFERWEEKFKSYTERPNALTYSSKHARVENWIFALDFELSILPFKTCERWKLGFIA